MRELNKKYCRNCIYCETWSCSGYDCQALHSSEAIFACEQKGYNCNATELCLALNFNGNCKYYKRKWWKFWVAK